MWQKNPTAPQSFAENGRGVLRNMWAAKPSNYDVTDGDEVGKEPSECPCNRGPRRGPTCRLGIATHRAWCNGVYVQCSFTREWQWRSVGPLRGPGAGRGDCVRQFLAPLGLCHCRLRQSWTASPPPVPLYFTSSSHRELCLFGSHIFHLKRSPCDVESRFLWHFCGCIFVLTVKLH